MSREWKPGDVAISSYGRVLRCSFDDGEGGWTFDDGSGHAGNKPPDLRPLVVIDPEDREQVERLWRMWRALAPDRRLAQDNLEAALREFANPAPPKPEEPMGLGAVVEDRDGLKWLRMTGVPGAEYTPWASADKGLQRYDREYSEIAAIRVLSEGVAS